MKSRRKGTGRLLAVIVAGSVAAAAPVAGAENGPEAGEQAQKAKSGDAGGGDIGFLKSQGDGDWLASALIGRSVQDNQGKSVGDINDVLLKDGRIKAVLIGVGGFLGLGQKEVAVSASALEFRKKEESSAYQRSRDLPRSLRDQGRESGGDGQASGETGGRGDAHMSGEGTAKGKDDRHSDMYIVLNVTKQQLEAAPSFARLGQKSGNKDARKDSGDSAAEQTQAR